MIIGQIAVAIAHDHMFGAFGAVVAPAKRATHGVVAIDFFSAFGTVHATSMLPRPKIIPGRAYL